MANHTCEQCGTTLVTISLRVSTGLRTMYSCSKCDLRIWDAEGSVTDLAGVLDELSDTVLPRQNSRTR